LNVGGDVGCGGRGPTFEKRPGTKSREVGSESVAVAMGICRERECRSWSAAVSARHVWRTGTGRTVHTL
jgi:hypothetical protein